MNPQHLPIGQFAQLCRLTIEALCHCDELGLQITGPAREVYVSASEALMAREQS